MSDANCLETALDAIREAFPGEWEERDGVVTLDGEDADGIPAWRVEIVDKDTYIIRRTLGWYEQCGEAYCWEECITVMRAMGAAHAALFGKLRALEEGTPLGPEVACRKCSGCNGNHHWMWGGSGLGQEGAEEQICQVMECKHCDAIRRMGDDEDPG